MSVYDTSVTRRHFVITPHDTDEIKACRAIFVGGTGSDVTITDIQGNDATYEGISGILPVSPTIVKATGTTATNIIGLI